MTECPALTSISANQPFITVDNIDDLVPNTFSRTVGTDVFVQCRTKYILEGQSNFTCLASGQWSYEFRPQCVLAAPTTTESPDDGVENDTKILIGVVCGVAGLIVIILIAMIAAVWYRDRRQKRLNQQIRNRMALRDRPDSRYRNRDRYSIDDDSMPPPPYRYSDKRPASRSIKKEYDDGSQMSRNMYLPGKKPSYHGSEKSLKKSMKRPRSIEEDFEQRGSRPYVREWIRRSMSEEFDVPPVHGRGGGYRESQLWRHAN